MEDLSYDRAFSHVVLDILGYDPDVEVMSDGKGDFGVDFCRGDRLGLATSGSQFVTTEAFCRSAPQQRPRQWLQPRQAIAPSVPKRQGSP